jgi:putative holliday junction resolvase
VLPRARRRVLDHRAVAGLVAELGVERVIVGLPLSLDGGTGPAARAAIDEASQLRAVLDVPVELHDERLTTVEAGHSLLAMNVKGGARRKVVDQVAAAVLLQSWLDSQAVRSSPVSDDGGGGDG